MCCVQCWGGDYLLGGLVTKLLLTHPHKHLLLLQDNREAPHSVGHVYLQPMDWSAEWSAEEDEGSPVLEPAGPLVPETADFLGGRGFSTSFFGAGRPQLQPLSAPSVGQLEALQDQLRNQASYYMEQQLFGSPQREQGDHVYGGEEDEDVLSEVLADLDERVGLPQGGSLDYGPPAEPGLADSLSRLLSRMLGLGGELPAPAEGGAPGSGMGGGGGEGGAWNAAVGGGAPDVAHRLRMLQLGFPSAVEASRHAALAAEGVPASRMAAEPRQIAGPLPAMAGLWSLTDDGLEPRAQGQQHRMRRNFGSTHLREGLAMAAWRRPEPLDSAVPWLSEPESEGSGGTLFLSDVEGRRAAQQASGRSRRRRARRSERPAVPRSGARTGHAANGAPPAGWSDNDMPDLVEDAGSSSSESEEAMPLLVPERAAWQPQPPRRPARSASAATGLGRSTSFWDEPPPLVSDGSDSGEESLFNLASVLRRGAGAQSAHEPAANIGAPPRPLRTLRHSRQQGQEEGGEAPPTRRRGEWSPPRRRERRAAIFGQLPGLGAGQLTALLEYGGGSLGGSDSASDGMPDLLSIGGSGSAASISGSLASLGSPPGLEPYSDYETMPSLGSSDDGGEDDRVSDGLPMLVSEPEEDGREGCAVPATEPPLLAVSSLQHPEAASQQHGQGHLLENPSGLAGLAEAGPSPAVCEAASATGAGGLAAASVVPQSAGSPFSPSEVAAAVRQAVGVANASGETAGQAASQMSPSAEGPSGSRKQASTGLALGSRSAGADQPAASDAAGRMGVAGRLLGAGAGLLRIFTGQGNASA